MKRPAWLLLAVAPFMASSANLQAQTALTFRTPAETLQAVQEARKQNNMILVEKLLRNALQQWPQHPILESYLGATLFSTHRLDEGYPYLTRICTTSGFEADCAVSVGIDLVRNRWEQALTRAKGFTESACQRSDRLWTLKQLAINPAQAVRAAQRLLTAEPDKETSYLFLAAAQWKNGKQDDARRTLSLGKEHATKIVLLEEPIDWRSTGR